MIRNKTARDLMYSWHGGQWSAFYAAVSSGLVASWSDLIQEVCQIDEPDRTKLREWLEYQMNKPRAVRVCAGGTFYGVLPWVSRTHYPEVK